MQNRFTHSPRLIAAGVFLLLYIVTAQAQQGFFNFTPPTFLPPTPIAVNNNCLGAVSFGPKPTVTPTTPGAVMTINRFSATNPYDSTDLFPVGNTLLVEWEVADNMGHTALFGYGVIFEDQTDPVFDMVVTPTPLLVNSIAEVPVLGPIPVTDNCSSFAEIMQTFSQTTPPPLCEGGMFSRTWSAKDSAGNITIYTQQIQVFKDTLNPVITVAPQNGSAPCASLPLAFTTWLADQMALFQATDPSGVTYSNNAPAILGDCIAPITVKFTATDACGFPKSVNATFSSTDTDPPVVIVEPKDTIAFCSTHQARLAEFIHTKAYSQVEDACSDQLTWHMLVNGVERDSAQVVAILEDSLLNNTCGVKLIGSQSYTQVKGYVRVDFFAEDACGNDVFVGQGVFGVRDTTPPVITGGGTFTEQCGGGNDQTALTTWINAHAAMSVTDNCADVAWADFTYTTSNGPSGAGVFGIGPYPTVQGNNCTWYTDVTFRAVDECGNSKTKTARFQLFDNIAPTIGGFSDTTFIYCPTALPATFSATVTDNCSTGLMATYTTKYADTICAGNYTFKVFWTATDQCNNTGTRTQYFAIRDTLAPQFTLVPANLTVSCDSFQLLPAPVMGVDVTAADVCGLLQGITVTTTNTRHSNPNNCGHYNFTITRTYRATDQCGNSSTAAQVITVRDIKPPTAAIPLPDTTIQCQSLPLTAAIPPAIDQCSPVVGPVTQVSQTIQAGSCPDSYTIVVTWKATDVCGNTGFFSRNYHVIDTIKPMITAGVPLAVTVECDAIPAPPALNSLVLSDNCDATPGVVFAETEIRDPNLNNCNHWSNYQIRREWTVSDACLNSRTYQQIITVMDNTPPVLLVKDTVLLPNTPGLCGANVLPPAPLSVYDVCAVLPQAVVLRDTTPITGPPSSSALCDTVFLNMSAGHFPPLQPVNGAASLTVYLDNADAEGPAEFFRVYGENGVLIGQTAPIAAQCGSGSTTFTLNSTLLNDWLTDGQLSLTLVPNGTGDAAINPICPGRRVRAEVGYSYLDPQSDVVITYSIDGGAQQSYPPSGTTYLTEGQHTIVYTATDCVGNSQTATSIIRIDDIQPPLLTVLAPQTAFTGVNNCSVSWPIPRPWVSENCAFSGFINQASALSNIRFVANANTGFVPEPITLSIVGLIPNAFSGGVLKICHRGDNSKTGEFFKVLDEQNNQLSITTNAAPADACVNFHETSIAISAAQINAWAADGVVQIKLVANTDAINFADFINPCGPLNAQNFDGISVVQAKIAYDYAILNYTVVNSQQTVIQTGALFGSQTVVPLTAGNYTINYNTADVSGNIGTATMALTVRDTVRPVAICQNRTIFASVTGAAPYNLTSAEIDNGSYDNCSGNDLDFTLSQTLFTCNQSGQIVPVALTVTDTSGNSSTCIAQVRVETEQIPASSTANICEGGTAQLFAQPPGNPANYTYLWSGPNMYSSLAQNPTLLNASMAQEGTYMVVVTGPTGCTAAGSTQLQLIGLPVQPVLNISSPLICLGQQINLTTGAYNGTDVTYQWYRNSIDTLIATTIQPNLTLTNLPAGNYQFFVRIVDLNCSSALSAPKQLVVQAPVAATVTSTFLNPCEGDLISLGTTIHGTGITYSWTGPRTSTAQYPTPFPAQLTDSGTYTLVVSANGCPGTAATTTISVRDRPDQPAIFGGSGVCVGATVQLVAQPPTGNFLWISPDADTIAVSNTNALSLNNVMLSDSGYWKVIAVLNGCASPASLPHLIEVQDYPVVVANANTPLCQGGALLLSADVSTPAAIYQWTGPGGFMAFTQETSDATPETGLYQIVATTSFGCSGTGLVQADVVNPPVITSVTSNAPTCVDGGTNIELFHTVVSPNGPFTYMWTFPSGVVSTDAFPIIPSATTANNGVYSLVVKDKYGCASLPQSTTISAQMTPPLPILGLLDPVCAGTLQTIQIANAAVYQTGTPIFIWDTPNNQDFPTNQPQYLLASTSLIDEGFYTVKVLVGSCLSEISAPLFVDIKPKPNPPDVFTNSPVCEGDTLYFETGLPPLVVPELWQWSGPAGFSPPSIGNPFRTPVMPNHAGDYFVRITVNGCTSDQSEPIVVEVKPKPATPVAIHEGNVCLEQIDTLVLKIAPGTQTNLAEYQWFMNVSDAPLGDPGLSPVFELSNFNGLSHGQNSFYVVANLDGCTSRSFPVSAVFDTIPDIKAVATNDYVACDDIAVYLSADFPSIGSGSWTQVSGAPVVFTDPNNIYTQVIGPVAGNVYSFAWTLSSGACINFSSDTVEVTVVAYQPAMAIADIDTCFATSIQLSATQGVAGPGYWSQPISQSQFQPPIVITDPSDPNTTVTGLPEGSSNFYYFTWTVGSGNCGSSTDTVVVRVIGTVPNAGPNRALCTDDDCVPINASDLLPSETGRWTSSNPDVLFISSGSPSTEACGLIPGANQLIWETNGGLCGAASRDTVTITYEQTPEAAQDVVQVSFGTPITFNVSANDDLPSNYVVTLSSTPQTGQLVQHQTGGSFTYTPEITFDGNETFIYTVCNLNCTDTTFSNRCDIAQVLLQVAASPDCEIPSVITPNGDNINDVFFIPPCLMSCADCVASDNELTIFNQWGDHVFHAEAYEQNWSGTYNGEDLPAGTYYYVFRRVLNGTPETKAGFIIIQR